MSVPSEERGNAEPGPDGPLDFDPYRFGRPEHPVPAEFAPPGYRAPDVPREPNLPRTPPPPRYQPGQYANPYPPRSATNGAASNSKAIASMVLGIASIVLCWLTILDVVPIVLAVVFGLIAVNDHRRDPGRGGRAMAITGIVCAAIGAVLAIVLTVWFVNLANQCGGLGTNSSQLQQCVRDHI